MPLSKLPHTFGIEGQVLKGNFPYYLNSNDNWNYVGKWPDIKYYDTEHMPVKARTAFLEWYNQNLTKTFNFREELVGYCRADTDILLRSCMYFRQLFIEMTKLDPFTRAITLP